MSKIIQKYFYNFSSPYGIDKSYTLNILEKISLKQMECIYHDIYDT